MSVENGFVVKTDNTIEKKGASMKVERAQGYDEKTLRDILSLEEKCFPEGWQYDDAAEYYRGRLEEESSINIVVRNGNETVGYMLLIPHDEAFEDLSEDDPEMKKDPERYYVETTEILPEYRTSLRGGKIFVSMMEKAMEELKKKGITKFSAHTRTTTKLDQAVKRYFGDRITLVREIPNWEHGGGERYEYIEGNIEK